ncbi:MAG: glycosyltransferase family 4 protein [Candidatus Bathyarchaeota archaeon]|nr:MAG: glycosyltransferase family 4 protein [Candidatus Bathyarchaeota archaeon]
MSSALLKPLGFKWVADIWDHPELWKAVRAGGIMKRLLVNVPRIATFEIVKRALKHADLVISAIHPSALTKFRIRPQRILAITNGVDLSITRPKGLKRSDSEFKLFYVGFLMKERGLDLMLNTVALLKGRIESLKLILVGDAKKEDVAHLNRTAKNLDLEQHVDFLGRLNHENVLTQMEGSDVCLFPFPRQAAVNCIYPVKIFEYMAMGKAIVATRLEGVSSIIKDGINGLLVDPGDAREMADAVFEIHENPDLRRRLEANAKKDVEEYDWKKINKKIDERLLGYNIRRK